MRTTLNQTDFTVNVTPISNTEGKIISCQYEIKIKLPFYVTKQHQVDQIIKIIINELSKQEIEI